MHLSLAMLTCVTAGKHPATEQHVEAFDGSSPRPRCRQSFSMLCPAISVRQCAEVSSRPQVSVQTSPPVSLYAGHMFLTQHWTSACSARDFKSRDYDTTLQFDVRLSIQPPTYAYSHVAHLSVPYCTQASWTHCSAHGCPQESTIGRSQTLVSRIR